MCYVSSCQNWITTFPSCSFSTYTKVKVKIWTLVIAPLTWVRLVTSALQSQKWQLIHMSQWCRSALCGHPLPALTDNWTNDAANRHTIAQISHTRPSPRSRSYIMFLLSYILEQNKWWRWWWCQRHVTTVIETTEYLQPYTLIELLSESIQKMRLVAWSYASRRIWPPTCCVSGRLELPLTLTMLCPLATHTCASSPAE